MKILFLIGMAYIIGSIPTAIIVSKYVYRKDVREYGSKNAGATNVFRVLGWKPGLFVLLFDMFKGYAATAILPNILFASGGASLSLESLMIIGGFSSVFGHIWTIFAGFKGGKGVATGAGMLIGLSPQPVLGCIVIFILIVALTRMVSVGSISAATAYPVILFIQKYGFNQQIHAGILIISLFIPMLIIYTHRANIKRILNGTENKIVFKK